MRAVAYYSVRLRKSDRERARDRRRDAQILPKSFFREYAKPRCANPRTGRICCIMNSSLKGNTDNVYNVGLLYLHNRQQRVWFRQDQLLWVPKDRLHSVSLLQVSGSFSENRALILLAYIVLLLLKKHNYSFQAR
jgi:hypothetical protein